jgi:hypothetical protein
MSIPVWSDRTAEVVASAEQLAGLDSLEIGAMPRVATSFVEEPEATARRLSIMARSPHLGELRELRVIGEFNDDCIAALIRKPGWTRLCRLHLEGWFNGLEPLATADDLGALEELRLLGIELGRISDALALLARSPLLSRLRHFALDGDYRGIQSLMPLVDAIDSSRIETLALRGRGLQPADMEACRTRFGDRLRIR